MNQLFAVIFLGVLCAAWIVLQRWIASIDPDVGNNPHIGCRRAHDNAGRKDRCGER
jgi:hypothetical protein